MIRLAIILSVPVLLHAQTSLVTRGAEVFRTSCAVAYCHGPEGAAGRAPQLAGRAFKAGDLISVIRGGKAGAGMPGFSDQLKSEDMEAVTQYVLSLQGPAGASAATRKPDGPGLPPEAQKGRALFFDAVRLGGCGKCHEIDDRGSPVGPDLRGVTPEKLRNLRALPGTRVVTVSPGGEDPFPALEVEKTPARVRVYDLSSPLPVMRTFQATRVRITPGAAWSHSDAVQNYSDSELEAIANYLKWRVE